MVSKASPSLSSDRMSLLLSATVDHQLAEFCDEIQCKLGAALMNHQRNWQRRSNELRRSTSGGRGVRSNSILMRKSKRNSTSWSRNFRDFRWSRHPSVPSPQSRWRSKLHVSLRAGVGYVLMLSCWIQNGKITAGMW